GTGIFWFFVFPVSAFFLAGGRGGAYWLAGLIAITVLLAILSELDLVEIPYTLVTIRQLLLCLTVVGVGIYTYQLAREKYEKQRAAEQQELDHAKNEFLTLASHQLRTPISAISWFSEMLLHGDAGKLTKAQREHIQQVYASNQRSASIVDAIIMVSNLQSGTLGARPEPVDLQKLCHETLEEQMDAQTVARRLKIKEIYDPELKHIQWDPGLIKTIIRNLVSNAIKYTPDEGEITISIGLRDSAKQHDSQQHMLYIEVSDTGYGIPKNEQHKIFAKLFRASNIKTKDTDGTGLGLYIVKAILAQAGGQISFKSTENKGSTFTVLLPSSGASQDMSSKVGA
ncbi:MAG TPA: HAMP domain-containing sensor histidine kinase, partial [Candidatus Saccharimonadales bacterium]|nr:HAMP domain-containing sensor histidine kinase [Candidatus Saccharimonadales bacterium]